MLTTTDAAVTLGLPVELTDTRPAMSPRIVRRFMCKLANDPVVLAMRSDPEPMDAASHR